MNKQIIVDVAIPSLKNIHNAGIFTRVNLIYALPFQKPSDVKNSLIKLAELKPYVNYFYFFKFFLSGDFLDNPKR